MSSFNANRPPGGWHHEKMRREQRKRLRIAAERERIIRDRKK